MTDANEKLGIALGGGGSLGSYEMGVWSALRELHLEPEVISGTSIGALIGAFMTQDDYDTAASLWHDVTPDKIMRDGLNFQWQELAKTYRNDRKRILTFTKRYLMNRGADISPLIAQLNANIKPELIRNSPKRFGVVAVELPFFIQRNIEIKKVPESETIDWLLASSAVWPLFPLKTIKRKLYIDGGYKDTLPIKFAFDLGATKVIVVNLFYKINWHPLLNKRNDVVNIEPSWNLGMPFNFNQKSIDRNRSLGYNDAMKKLGGYDGYRYTFYPDYEVAPLSEELRSLIDERHKQLSNAITARLARHTGGSMKPHKIFFRGLEVLAETIKIDPTTIYNVPDIARLCYETIDSHFEIKQIVSLLKKLRGQKPLSDKDERTAIAAIKFTMETHYHERDIIQFAARKATYTIIYLMFTLIYRHFIQHTTPKRGTSI